MKLTQLQTNPRFFGFFLGRSKSGKSFAAASFPKPILVHDFDGRARGMLGAEGLVPDLDQIEVNAYPPKGGMEKFLNNLNILELQLQTKSCPYKTLILDSITTQTHACIVEAMGLTKGKMIGKQKMAGPEDYGYEAQQTYAVLDFLKAMPINVIVSAHLVDKFGKVNPSDPYSASDVVGEKLSIRDKIGENLLLNFDEVYRFERREGLTGMKHYVKFRSDIAATTYRQLPNGEVDITNKNFYQTWLELINKGENK